ncbi:uncharacterized protein At4g02000 [Brachypodium distachyon]|uniref:uncharacterized protein At4g02000 n=1 Tax=Brachypodium distachyon TaxID=15368 RepID=UPI000530018E|nr:uncharacterized protein At4g02000 [Brachypodium distachyon]|eukprot:XP_010239050.1 uncharacterized protein At4g02000 [Brachypodium distachyon]
MGKNVVQGKGDGDLEKAMKNLAFREGELDVVVIEQADAEEMEKEFRWLALARVHTPRPFSVTGFKETMRSIWSLVHDADCREVDDNLFLIRFFCLDNWKKVMNQGPWLFRGFMVVIHEYDGLSDKASIPFNHTAIWEQIHSIPDLYWRESVCDQLARRIGRVLSVEMNPPKYYEGDYIRVRASIDVREPLIRCVPLKLPKERLLLDVRYEKVGFFCDVCGLFGHTSEE